MSFFQYELAGPNGQTINKAWYGGAYFEIPAVVAPDGTIDSALNLSYLKDKVSAISANKRRMNQAILLGPPIYGWQDKVFVNGQVVREDASLFYPQAQGYLATLQAEFPNSFVDYASSQKNVLGGFGAYREPYQNESISWYEFIKMPAAVAARYQVDLAAYGDRVLPWYGLKHDLVTKQIWLKLPLQNLAFATPPLPAGDRFFSLMIQENGTISPFVDAYVTATDDFMRDYCAQNGLTFPVGESVAPLITLWGVVFNADTSALTTVKAYYEYAETPVV